MTLRPLAQVLRSNSAESADTIGSSLLQWYLIRCGTLSNTRSFVRTTPFGSTSSKCLWLPFLAPVSTNCPGHAADSRTRNSPSSTTSFSAVVLEIGPWNHGSRASKAACACAESGSAGTSLGDDTDAVDDDDAADDDTGAAVNGCISKMSV